MAERTQAGPVTATADARVHADLRALAARYAHAADTRDAGLMVSVFSEEGQARVFDPGSRTPRLRTGREELRQLADVLTRFPKTFHCVGQSLYEVHGDTATGEVYCVAHHLTEEDGAHYDRVVFLRYEDEYGRDADGEWKITVRTIIIEWIERRRLEMLALLRDGLW